MSAGLGFRPRRHMTRWLDPVQLMKSGWVVLTARQADRARDAMGGEQVPVADYTADADGDFWFDYVADLGDAFDPTMAVAWHLGRRRVRVPPDEEGLYPAPLPNGLPRGRFLVMGGDEVYPYATARRYDDQCVQPYSLAFEGDGEADLFALPGNHDWYGKLGPFRSVFCSGKGLGNWKCRQTASWFAIALPHGWWLWGLDTGLRGDLNVCQQEYFAAAAGLLHPGDRIIMCTPVPLWTLHRRHPQEQDRLQAFVNEVVGDRASVPLWLAGDSHLFAAFSRQRASGREVHVISGGGGAFLHPTHHLLVDAQQPASPEFSLIDAWPSPARSRVLADPGWRVVWDRQSRLLVPLLALVHLGYAGLTNLRWLSWVGSVGTSPLSALGWVLSSPVSWLALALLASAGVLAVSPNSASRLVSRGARRRGLVLGLVQVFVFVLASATGRFAAAQLATTSAGRLGWMTLAAMVGALTSLTVFGLSLARVNRSLDVADNTVLSARHVALLKHFVRCRIDGATGRLDLYVIGIRDPGHGWADAMASEPHRPPASCSEPQYVWGCTVDR